jgi:hypothetical protein
VVDIAEVTKLIGDLQSKVESDPQAARDKIAELRAKYDTLAPEQQEQVKQLITELRQRAQNLPPELQQQLGDIVGTIRSGAPTGSMGTGGGGTPTG